jgi:hypothetical protein
MMGFHGQRVSMYAGDELETYISNTDPPEIRPFAYGDTGADLRRLYKEADTLRRLLNV